MTGPTKLPHLIDDAILAARRMGREDIEDMLHRAKRVINATADGNNNGKLN